MLYAEFIKKDTKKNNKEVNSTTSKVHYRNRSMRWIIGTSIAVLVLVCFSIGVFFVAPFVHATPEADNPSNSSSPQQNPSSSPSSPTPIVFPSIDQEVLVEFYHATRGEGWRATASPSTSVCEWAGVICDPDYRVFELDLDSANLYGTLPDSLGKLRNLKSLRVSSNALFGTIPASIGNLTNLVELVISLARFNGTVPLEIFSLPFLETLNVGGNPHLSWTIPPQIGNLKFLNTFVAPNSGLQGTVPNEISKLKRLTMLSLSNNNLTGTVPNLTNTRVAYLFLHGNQFTGTIPELTTSGMFSGINLSHNQFSGSVEHLGHLRTFARDSTILLVNNSLSGEFYLPLSILPDVEHLDISHNNFTTLSPWWTNVTLRADCNASNNPWRCPIPDWFKNTCKATCT